VKPGYFDVLGGAVRALIEAKSWYLDVPGWEPVDSLLRRGLGTRCVVRQLDLNRKHLETRLEYFDVPGFSRYRPTDLLSSILSSAEALPLRSQ